MNGNEVSDVLNAHTQQTEDRSQHSAVGTPDYLAPEILLGTEHGYATDWWSVGVILFELVTGIPPFTAERPEIIFYNILNRKIPWPPVPDSMSYEAQDLINRLISHDPNQHLGGNGSTEIVKSHPFFGGVEWDNLALQKMDECGDLAEFDSSPLSLINFSFKNLSVCKSKSWLMREIQQSILHLELQTHGITVMNIFNR